MNAAIKPELQAPQTSAEITTRIHQERVRLNSEQNLEIELDAQCAAALETSDDKALDRLEGQLSECNNRQSRIQRRIEILEQRLIEAQQREQETNLDAVAARADRIRLVGEAKIREYGVLARKIAQLLPVLQAADIELLTANAQLRAGGRNEVAVPNQIRARRTRVEMRKVKKVVAVSNPLHPFYGVAKAVTQVNKATSLNRIKWFANGIEIPHETEIEVDEAINVYGYWPTELTDSVVLPGIEPPNADETENVPFWSRQHAPASSPDFAGLANLLDAPTASPQPKGKVK